MIQAISSWIINIAGISILSVLIDLILPDGQTNKYIKAVFAFFIVFVIISPIPKLLNKEINMDEIFVENEMLLQNEYIYQMNRKRLDNLEGLIESAAEEVGLKDIKISLSANIFVTDMTIDAVFVDLERMVITDGKTHINTDEEIISCVKKYIKIEEDKIFFNGR